MSSIQKFHEVPHPTNRVWPGTPFSVMPSEEEAYQDGFHRGATWPENWAYVPGGPLVGSKDPRFKALCDQESRVHRSYMQGWHAGFVKAHPHLPTWYKRYLE